MVRAIRRATFECLCSRIYLHGDVPEALTQSPEAGAVLDSVESREEFSAISSNYSLESFGTGNVAALVREDGKSFVRLASAPAPSVNSVTFAAQSSRAFERLVLVTRVRISQSAGRGDGFGIAWLDSTTYGVDADGPFVSQPESPNFQRSLAIGVDVFQNHFLQDVSDNHISIHYDGKLVKQVDVPRDVFDFASGVWFTLTVDVSVQPNARSAEVEVAIVDQADLEVFRVKNIVVNSFQPYPGKLWMGARSGGALASHDVDEVYVRLDNPVVPVVSLSEHEYFVSHAEDMLHVVVDRQGDLTSETEIKYSVFSDMDGAEVSTGVVHFAPGVSWRTIHVPVSVLNDDDPGVEKWQGRIQIEERFGGFIGDESTSSIVRNEIVDPSVVGRWSGVSALPTVPIHIVYLATDRLLFWDRNGNVYDWDFARGAEPVSVPRHPGFDVFCAGNIVMPNGHVFLAGGHTLDIDGVGVEDTISYDPFRRTWVSQPRMNVRRWYPTETLLPDGRVHILSGSNGEDLNAVQVVETFDAASGMIDQVGTLQRQLPLYPFVHVISNGNLLISGPQTDVFIINGNELGRLVPTGVARAVFRDYGTSMMFDRDRVLLVGGNSPNHGLELPEHSAEIVSVVNGEVSVSPTGDMRFRRRQHTGSVLPDGSVLVTGGHSSPGFNDAEAPVLAAEVWDPKTGAWSLLSAMQSPRLYHSIAMVLPDGRVLVGGGGQPYASGEKRDHPDYEIFSPPYLFKGDRPKILRMASHARVGQLIELGVDNPNNVSRVTVLSLPAVTHGFNQNQRFVSLETRVLNGKLVVTIPQSPAEIVPGFYMLFVINEDGVPSEARIIQIGNEAPVSPWQNSLNNYDVNGDGYVSPIDVLRVLRTLRRRGSGTRLSNDVVSPQSKVDVNGDNRVDGADAWLIVDQINHDGPNLT